MEDRRSSSRNHKIVNYAKLNGIDDDDDDFRSACQEGPAKKRVKTENTKPEKKNPSRKSSQSKSKDVLPSQQNKRLSVEDRVFQRHMHEALAISKHNTNVSLSKESCTSSDSQESKSSSDVVLIEEDDDFKPKSSPPSNKSNSATQKATVRKAKEKTALQVQNSEGAKVAVTDHSETENDPMPEMTPEISIVTPEVEEEDTEVTEDITEVHSDKTEPVFIIAKEIPVKKRDSFTAKKSPAIKRADNVKPSIPKTNSPINLPAKGIRLGLSRKVRTPLHTGVQRMS